MNNNSLAYPWPLITYTICFFYLYINKKYTRTTSFHIIYIVTILWIHLITPSSHTTPMPSPHLNYINHSHPKYLPTLLTRHSIRLNVHTHITHMYPHVLLRLINTLINNKYFTHLLFLLCISLLSVPSQYG